MANPVFDLITQPYEFIDGHLFYYQLIFLLGLFDTMHDFHNNSLLSFYKQYLDNFNITTRELHPLLKPIKVLRHAFATMPMSSGFNINYYTIEHWINTINDYFNPKGPIDIFSEHELRAFPIHQSRLDKNLFIHEIFNSINRLNPINSYNIHELNSTIIYNFKILVIYIIRLDFFMHEIVQIIEMASTINNGDDESKLKKIIITLVKNKIIEHPDNTELFEHLNISENTIIRFRNLLYTLIELIKKRTEPSDQASFINLFTIFNNIFLKSHPPINSIDLYTMSHEILSYTIDNQTYPSSYIYDQGDSNKSLNTYSVFIHEKQDASKSKLTYNSATEHHNQHSVMYNWRHLYGLKYNNNPVGGDIIYFNQFSFCIDNHDGKKCLKCSYRIAADTLISVYFYDNSKNTIEIFLSHLYNLNINSQLGGVKTSERIQQKPEGLRRVGVVRLPRARNRASAFKKRKVLNTSHLYDITELKEYLKKNPIDKEANKFIINSLAYGAKRAGDWIQCIQASRNNLLLETQDFYCQVFALAVGAPIILDFEGSQKIYNANIRPAINLLTENWEQFSKNDSDLIISRELPVDNVVLPFYSQSKDLNNSQIFYGNVPTQLFTSIIKKYLKYKNKYLKYKNGATHNPITKEPKLDLLNYEQIKTKYLKYKKKYLKITQRII
jgi:hypothetical protein